MPKSVQHDTHSTKSSNLLVWLFGLMMLTLPFAIDYTFGSHKINFPSEPLLILISLLLGVFAWQRRKNLSSLWQSSMTKIGTLWIAWMWIASLFSSDLLVSAKYSMVRTIHWLVFYAGVLLLVKYAPKLPKINFLLYTLSFLSILLYAWTVHAQYDFSIDTSVLVARPFYFDHALYSCCILLLLGFWGTQVFDLSDTKHRRWQVIGIASICLLLIIGVYLSYSRAAWMSALLSIGAIIMIVFYRLKMKGFLLVVVGGLLAGLLLLYGMKDSNLAESKSHGLSNQILSIGNLTTDVSNLERINRYSCAWRMFLDCPFVGYGPGTYQFAYLSYQRPEEMTRISVTDTGPHGPGRGGGAHSEYLQALSEMGLIGGILFIALLLSIVKAALRVFHHSGTEAKKYRALGILFALLTFYIHGLFNNFMHHDKVAALVWGLMAIVAHMEQEVDH